MISQNYSRYRLAPFKSFGTKPEVSSLSDNRLSCKIAIDILANEFGIPIFFFLGRLIKGEMRLVLIRLRTLGHAGRHRMN